MMRDGLDRDLQRLREACARIAANLVDLEIDSSRQLLEASKLAGESAAAWAAASAALTELWRRHGLLEGTLKRADELDRARRHDELRDLLRGRSIELSSADVPLVERDLLGSSRAAQRCTPAELLAGMSASFDEVKSVIARIGGAWDTLIPQLDSARRLLQQTRQLAHELGGPESEEVRSASAQLDALAVTVTADPLAARPADVEALTRTLQEIRAELEHARALERGFGASLLAARELLERVRSTERDEHAAHEELLVKISVTSPPPFQPAREDLERELDAVAALGARGAWLEAQRELDAWTRRATALLEGATRALAASRAPIQARNQLRALLDAYQVKAKRLGILEEPQVAEIFDAAHEALYRAPTDLALAARLVRSYQQAINGPATEAEATL
jgi:hypothetical protein